MEVNSIKEKADIEKHNDLAGIVSQDIPEFTNLLKDMILKLQEVKNQLQPIAERISSKEIRSNKGISLLDIKYHLMLQYLTHLAFFAHLKLSGRPIATHPTISTLAEIRVVLEKIRPLEGRLKYQVDKLVRAATVNKLEGERNGKKETGATNGIETIVNDPLRFRPNPENLIKADGTDENTNDNTARPGLYRPPKLAPVAYEEDTRTTTKQARDQVRLLAKAKNSRIVRDLISEMNDMPEEMDAVGGVLEVIGYGEKVDSVMQERENYEEENFIRLTMSKKEKKKILGARERGRFENEFENLEDFGGLVGIEDIEKTQAEQMKNVLVRRNMRNRERENGELEERGPAKRSRMEGDRIFDGLLSDPKTLGRKGKTQFEKAKKHFKAGKKKRK